MKTRSLKMKKGVKPCRREKRKAKAYSTYIYKLHKENSKCVAVPRRLSGETFHLVVSEAARLSKYNKRGTITRHEVHSAVKLLRPKRNSGKEGA